MSRNSVSARCTAMRTRTARGSRCCDSTAECSRASVLKLGRGLPWVSGLGRNSDRSDSCDAVLASRRPYDGREPLATVPLNRGVPLKRKCVPRGTSYHPPHLASHLDCHNSRWYTYREEYQ